MKQAILIVALLALSGCSSMMGESARSAAAKLAGEETAAAGAGGQPGVSTGAISEQTLAFFQSEVGDRILFAVDQSTLSDDALLTLDAQAAWLTANPGVTAVIEGHADEQGTRDYNIALGERRAAAVFNYLVSRGITGSRLSTVSFGKERPLEICSEETCWSKNRRAVTVVAGGLTG